MSDVTQLLNAIEQGDLKADDELLPSVYVELRRLAGRKLTYESLGQTLQATALVHEAYVRLVDGEKKQRWESRGHFFAAAAEAMRRILVKTARRKRLLFPTLTALVILIQGAGADAQRAEDKPTAGLQKLRESYTDSAARAAGIDRPKTGTPDFREKLSAWSKAQQERTDAIHKLAEALLTTWATLPDESTDLPALETEIATLHQEALKPLLSEKSHNESQFFAGVIWKLVQAPGLSSQRASFLTTLTVPHAGIRRNDELADLNRPTEPYGWDIQGTHSLALLRAGRIAHARKENEWLLKKVNKILRESRLPNLTVNFRGGERTPTSLKREFLLHRSLIEATAGEMKAARAFLEEAKEIDKTDDITAAQESVLEEIASVLKETGNGDG